MENFIYGSEAKYTINEVSKITNLSKPTIRYYEDIGLLQNITRDKNNIRLFSDNQVMRLRMIQCMRSTGMGIDMIRHYIGLSNEDETDLKERYSIVLEQEEILLAKKEEIKKQLSFIEHKKQNYEEKLNNLQKSKF
ncbi:DNA-binding transcriptional MerR regulator [Clostridium saccharoperbutylacetonicum]|jgi:DNA-binding transcriptional MerR regulator|uniref:Putative transcriptional regulator, MerR family n=1 Tax=Clostridium saccharoperbutylacetonicum N1-4(HMT) TaxID=931276 RepID=M1MLD1_9CLOT|nr:MerR family transcriptional regulator [Clostridium saccharoperbutylacetonicum]AGF58719.1 putative transcriptional regulator, MerR family [Clostridium saccharoperbutylacetonicum N1-4(HMT)]NRT60502.1 DNA-binding transcriptional MerR regulator [Clostridium saccharoperbutylacetonicum]NSB23816.1 DNA-binding transcriptional MerR regulator [Clostridium saccharoperbutylacetonicum]NSB43192.1 DNA-binding transcriptional MerR regulator [Clostridium saccharoperbutylacetonicum]